MVAVYHVAILAGRRASRIPVFVQGAVHQESHTVLGTGPHFPLGMVETHVAGLASLGLLGLFFTEGVARVTVLAVHAVLVVLALFPLPGLLVDDALAVAAAATLLTGDEGIGLAMSVGHGAQGHVAQSMFAVQVLAGLVLVTFGTGFDGRQQGLVHIVVALVAVAMATGAVHVLGHHAAVEIGDEIRSDLRVAFLAVRGNSQSDAGKNRHQNCRDNRGNYQFSKHQSSSPLPIDLVRGNCVGGSWRLPAEP